MRKILDNIKQQQSNTKKIKLTFLVHIIHTQTLKVKEKQNHVALRNFRDFPRLESFQVKRMLKY